MNRCVNVFLSIDEEGEIIVKFIDSQISVIEQQFEFLKVELKTEDALGGPPLVRFACGIFWKVGAGFESALATYLPGLVPVCTSILSFQFNSHNSLDLNEELKLI